MYQTALTYRPFPFSEHDPLEDALFFTYRAVDADATLMQVIMEWGFLETLIDIKNGSNRTSKIIYFSSLMYPYG